VLERAPRKRSCFSGKHAYTGKEEGLTKGDGGSFPQLNQPINASLLSFATRRHLFRARHQSSTRPLDQFSRAPDNERAEGGYLLVFNLPERRRVTATPTTEKVSLAKSYSIMPPQNAR